MEREVFSNVDCVVVGAGITGLTVAERLSSLYNLKVVIVEKRAHIGGNCYTYVDEETGIECHKYGSHIFHTSNQEVWQYLNMFGAFNTYQHKVFAAHRGRIYPLPINLLTVNMFFGLTLTPSQINWDLMLPALEDAFYRGYTLKHWGRDLRDVPTNILKRVPVRTTYNCNYFDDLWQGIPYQGFTSLFQAMIARPNIQLLLNTNFFDVRHLLGENCVVVYTGPLDRYFEYKCGQLEWRAVHFQTDVVHVNDYQGTAVINYPDLDIPYTRIHEFQHLHPELSNSSGMTIISVEFPEPLSERNEPAYPADENGELAERYRKLAEEETERNRVFFGGRLGTYRYMDMDDAVLNAFSIVEQVAHG